MTPAFMVSWSIRTADLASKLDASSYLKASPSPEGTKNAPFTIKSPSDFQSHLFHSFSSESTLFVTYTSDVHSIGIFVTNITERLTLVQVSY